MNEFHLFFFGYIAGGFITMLLIRCLERYDHGYWGAGDYGELTPKVAVGMGWPLCLPVLPLMFLCIWLRKRRERSTVR